MDKVELRMDIQTIKQNFDLVSLVQGLVALKRPALTTSVPAPSAAGRTASPSSTPTGATAGTAGAAGETNITQ